MYEIVITQVEIQQWIIAIMMIATVITGFHSEGKYLKLAFVCSFILCIVAMLALPGGNFQMINLAVV